MNKYKQALCVAILILVLVVEAIVAAHCAETCEQCKFLAAHGKPTMNMNAGSQLIMHTPKPTASPTPYVHSKVIDHRHPPSSLFTSPYGPWGTPRPSPTPYDRCTKIKDFKVGQYFKVMGYSAVTTTDIHGCPAALVLIPMSHSSPAGPPRSR